MVTIKNGWRIYLYRYACIDTAFRDWDYADMLELAYLEYLWSILNCFGQGSHLNLHAGAKEYNMELKPPIYHPKGKEWRGKIKQKLKPLHICA